MITRLRFLIGSGSAMANEDGTTPVVVVAENNFLTAMLIVAALEESGLTAEIGRDGDQVSQVVGG